MLVKTLLKLGWARVGKAKAKADRKSMTKRAGDAANMVILGDTPWMWEGVGGGTFKATKIVQAKPTFRRLDHCLLDKLVAELWATKKVRRWSLSTADHAFLSRASSLRL